MPSPGTGIQPILFDPEWTVPTNIAAFGEGSGFDTTEAKKLLGKCDKTHAGIKRIIISEKIVKESRGKKRVGEDAVAGMAFTHARLGVRPEVPPELLAQIIWAIGCQHAAKKKEGERNCNFKVTFYGVPAPGETREPRAYASFHFDADRYDLPGGDDDGEYEDEEGEDEEGEDEEGEDEEGEYEDGEDEEGDEEEGYDDDEDDDWPVPAGNPANPYAPPQMRHEQGVQPLPHLGDDEYRSAFAPGGAPGAAPGYPGAPYPGGTMPPGARPGPSGFPPQPGHPYQQSFPPGAAPAYPSPQSMGGMTDPRMGMGQYRQEMHPAMAMFMHHLGGVFAETRASMREMRNDVRESRAEARAANNRLLNMANLSTAHYENMHRASQTGWNALHQGMSMQLNSLQNAMSWERKISELETRNEMDRRDAQQQQGGGALQTILALAPLVVGGVGQVMHYVKGAPGEPPPLLPPEMAAQMMGMDPAQMGGPPGMQPPGAPGMQPPPPPPGPGPQPGAGFGPPPPPPPPPGPAEIVVEPAPGSAPSAPAGHEPFPAGGSFMPNAHGPFVGQPPGPNGTDVVDAHPEGAITIEGADPQSTPSPSSSPTPPPAAPAGGPGPQLGQITADEVRARFQVAPLACMCDTLVKTTAELDAQRFIESDGDVWALLKEAGQGQTDNQVADQLGRLRDALDQPGRMHQLCTKVSKEHATLLTDIRAAIGSMTVQQSQPQSPPTWVSPLQSVAPTDQAPQFIPGSPDAPGFPAPAPEQQPEGAQLAEHPSPSGWVMSQTPPDFGAPPPLPEMPGLPVQVPGTAPGTGDPVLDAELEISVVPGEMSRPASAREPNRRRKGRKKKNDQQKKSRRRKRPK
jgi:hypothetical protein